MVMLKPIQVTKVSAVPFTSCGAVCATNAENCGESEMTAIPQISMKKRKTGVDDPKKNAEAKQQIPEINNETNATLALPILLDK